MFFRWITTSLLTDFITSDMRHVHKTRSTELQGQVAQPPTIPSQPWDTVSLGLSSCLLLDMPKTPQSWRHPNRFNLTSSQCSDLLQEPSQPTEDYDAACICDLVLSVITHSPWTQVRVTTCTDWYTWSPIYQLSSVFTPVDQFTLRSNRLCSFSWRWKVSSINLLFGRNWTFHLSSERFIQFWPALWALRCKFLKFM